VLLSIGDAGNPCNSDPGALPGLWSLGHRSFQGRVVAEESIPIGNRVRDVCEGPDGVLYVLTDSARDGQLIRLEPGEARRHGSDWMPPSLPHPRR
jgi:glucose/arabinose dehydrogenase